MIGALADRDLGVADASVGLRQAHDLDGAESLLVELQRLRGPADAQIRRRVRIVVGNGFDLASHASSCSSMPV